MDKEAKELEREFQARLIKDIRKRFPGAVVLKNDPNYIQGIPDLTVLYGNCWGVLECKRSESAKRRPNQEYYIDKLGAMSFASFISPETKEDVLDEMERSFKSCGQTCAIKSE